MNSGLYGFPNILGLLRATAVKALGKAGATAGATLAGGTTSGAPASGSFDQGDVVVGQDGHVFVCTAAGSPGTWIDAGTAGGLASPLTTKGDLWGWSTTNARVALGAAADGQVLRADSTQAAGLAWMAGGGVHVVSTSASGAVSDADLSQGSSTFGTDNTTVLQAVLDLATSAPLCVIWDGQYSTTGLVVHSNTTIVFLSGCGAILRTASNKPVLRNATLSWGTSLAPGDSAIALLGQGIINGNGNNQTRINAGVTGYLPGLRFWGVKGLVIEDLTILNTATFAVHCVNWQNVSLRNLVVDQGTWGTLQNGQDGPHFNGPGQGCDIAGLTLTTQDDGLAFNADDGGLLGITGVSQGYGSISDVLVRGLQLRSSKCGIRLLSTSSRLDRVHISGIRGSTSSQWLVLDNNPGGSNLASSGAGNIGSVGIEDVEVAVSTASGTPFPVCVWLNCTIESIRFARIARNDWTNTYPTFAIESGATIGLLAIDGLATNDTDGSNLQTAQVYCVGNVTLLSMSDVRLQRSSSLSATTAPLVQVNSASSGVGIGTLMLNDVSVDRASRVVDQLAGKLDTIMAVGLTHTNAGGGATFHLSGAAVTALVLSNYNGVTIRDGSVTPTTLAGDAFPGSGTVASVALSMPAEFSVSGSPVTASGTLAVTKATEAAGTVYAGPSSGADAAPTFRALGLADVPYQASSLLMILPNVNNFVADGTSDEQPPDFVVLSSGDVVGVGGM